MEFLIVIANFVWFFVGMCYFILLSAYDDKVETFNNLPLHKRFILGTLLFSPILLILLVIFTVIGKTIETLWKACKLDILYKKVYNYLWDIK